MREVVRVQLSILPEEFGLWLSLVERLVRDYFMRVFAVSTLCLGDRRRTALLLGKAASQPH